MFDSVPRLPLPATVQLSCYLLQVVVVVVVAGLASINASLNAAAASGRYNCGPISRSAYDIKFTHTTGEVKLQQRVASFAVRLSDCLLQLA